MAEAGLPADDAGRASAAPRSALSVHAESHAAGSADWLEESVFGTLDGVITSLALVVALDLILAESAHTVFLTVIAASVAGTISMFVGALLSARSRAQLIRRERAREEWEVDHVPEIERREVQEIYEKQGFSPAEVEILVKGVTSDRKRWVDMMMRDELGLPSDEVDRSTRHAGIIGFSYLIGCGLLALPYLFASHTVASLAGHSVGSDFVSSLSIGALVLASVGVLEARFSGTHPVRGAAEMIAIGLAAAIAVFLVTLLLTPA